MACVLWLMLAGILPAVRPGADARGEFEASLDGPPNLSQAHTRARSLGRWANEAERRGIGLPVDLVPTVSRALSMDEGDSPAELGVVDAELRARGYELGLREDRPAVIGRAELSAPTRIRVGERVRLRHVYYVGRRLPPESALVVAKHWRYPYSLQAGRPDANNFVSVSTDGDAKLAMETIVREGLHGGLYRGEQLPLAEVESGELVPGDTITIEYGANDRGFLMPDAATGEFVLPLYVRFGAGAPFVMIPVERFPVVAGPARRLRAVLPSIARTGEAMTLMTSVEDEFGNPASGNIPSLDILADGTFYGRLAAGNDSSPMFEGLVFEEPGIHRLAVRSSGGGMTAESNPVLVVDSEPTHRVLWGDLRGRAGLSDGQRSVRRGLPADVSLIADHDDFLTRLRWRDVPRRDGIRGFEWSQPLDKGGHHLVMTRADIEFDGVLRERFPTLRRLIRMSEPDQTIIAGLPEIPADVRFQDPGLTRLIEIKSGEGAFEWFGNRFAGAGHRVGFAGSSSSHLTRFGPTSSQGLTGIYVAPGETWWDAIRARRTYVTSGARMILRANLNNAMPGARIDRVGRRIVRGEVIGTSGIASVELIRNGEVIQRRDYAAVSEGAMLRITLRSSSRPWQDQYDLPRNGRDWMGYLKVTGAGVEQVLSPGFINVRRQAAAVNPAEPGRVDFITWTRGQRSSFLVALSPGLRDDEVTLEMYLKGGFEDIDHIPNTRPPQPITGMRHEVDLQALRFGKVVRGMDVEGYRDTVTLELVRNDLPRRQSFEFVDERDEGSQDYYYLRIEQIDDQYLWTSPIWVGGFDVH